MIYNITDSQRGDPVRYRLIATLLVSALAVWAQSTASLSGYVTDPSDAVIAGATVVITNAETGAVRRVTTDSQGRYIATPLETGTYRIDVRAPGFQPVERTGVVLNIGAQESLNFKLPVGTAQNSVTVAADATHIETENGQVGYLVSNKEIQNIAVNGRNFLSLATLVPGAASNLPDEPLVGNLGHADIAYNGSPSYQNVWLIDGAFNIDTAKSQMPLMTFPSLEALNEFRVLSNNYSAEYGMSGAAVITMGVKSGTNSWHGSAYEFVRNDDFDGRNAFLTQRQLLKQNDYGFTLGGPIRRDKDFFFYSQEWRTYRQTTAESEHAPTAQELAGDFSNSPLSSGKALKDPTGRGCVNGLQVLPSCFDPNALAIIKAGLFPTPLTNGAGFQNYVTALPNPQNFREEIARIDHRFSDTLMLFGHYIREDYNFVQPTPRFGPGTITTISGYITTPGTNAAIGLTKLFSANMVNELNLAYEGEVIGSVTTGPFQSPPGLNLFSVYPRGNNVVPGVNLAQGYGILDSGPNPWYSMEANYTVNDKMTVVRGAHTFKFGGLYQFGIKNQPIQTGQQGQFSFNGSFTGNSFADFLLGYPNSFSQIRQQLIGRYRFNQVEAFAQDDWKLTSRLTINLGVRYYFLPAAYERDNHMVNFLPSLYDPAQAPQLNSAGNLVPNTGNLNNGLAFPGNGAPHGLYSNSYHEFGPHFGFAWDPWGTGKTAIRGGYSLVFNRVAVGTLFNILTDYPFGTTQVVTNPPYDAGPFGGTVVSAPPAMTVINPNFSAPETQQYSFGIQRQLFGSTILTASYVGTHSSHMPTTTDINQPLPFGAYQFNPALNQSPAPSTNLFRPYTGWGTLSQAVSVGNSDYNSLQVNLEKRMTRNFHFQLGYTYSKALDNFDAAAQNPYNRQADWGLATFDHTQILNINYIYNLPALSHANPFVHRVLGGWEVAGVTTAQSGAPLNITLTGAGHGLATRPNLIAPVTYPKTVGQWFSTASFVAPPPGFYGNAGRDIVRGPGLQTWNVSLYKHFPWRDRLDTEFRAECFNILNHTNFMSVTTALGNGSFGQVTASHDPRIFQFGVRLSF